MSEQEQRPPEEQRIHAQHGETGRMWEGPRYLLPPGYAEVSSSDGRSITFTRGRVDLEFSIDDDGDLQVAETDLTSSRCFWLQRADLPALRDWLNKVLP